MNDTTTVERIVRETLAEVLGTTPGALADEPSLAAHHWDSLSSLHAFTELESRLGATFDLRSFHTAHTVEAVVDLALAVVGTDEERVA